MPQLMTNIWFKVLLMALSLFLYVLPAKIMTFTFLNILTPPQQQTAPLSLNPWAWDW